MNGAAILKKLDRLEQFHTNGLEQVRTIREGLTTFLGNTAGAINGAPANRGTTRAGRTRAGSTS